MHMNEKTEKFIQYSIKLLKDVAKGAFNLRDQEVFQEGIEIGINKTIDALYDGNINDDKIVSLMMKHWDIGQTEAEERLIFEKRKMLIEELEKYLKRKGWAKNKVDEFVSESKLRFRIRHEPELLKYKGKPEKLFELLNNTIKKHN